jgi:hypothetical protein
MDTGIRLHSWRAVRVEHGQAGVVREGAGVEGAQRREQRTLHMLHVCQLVFCVITVMLVTKRKLALFPWGM